MNLVIIGPCGYVGRHFLDRITLSQFNSSLLLTRHNNFFLGEATSTTFIDNHHLLSHVFKQKGGVCILNFAGSTHPSTECESDLINYKQPLELIKQSIDLSLLHRKRCLFIQLGSISVYGTSTLSSEIKLNSPLNPCNIYAASKALLHEDILSISKSLPDNFNLLFPIVSNIFGGSCPPSLLYGRLLASLSTDNLATINVFSCNSVRNFISIYRLIDFLIQRLYSFAFEKQTVSFSETGFLCSPSSCSVRKFVKSSFPTHRFSFIEADQPTFSMPSFVDALESYKQLING